jgi:phenylacetate-CoA ligase
MEEKVVYCYNPRFELMPREELKEFQLSLLKRQARYIYNFSELGKEKFDSVGIKPEDIKSLEDIRKIPVTVREEIEDRVDKGDPYGGACCAWTDGREVITRQFLKRPLLTGWPPTKPIYLVMTTDDFFCLTEQFVRYWRMVGVEIGDEVLTQTDIFGGDHLGMVVTSSPVWRPDVARILKCTVAPIIRYFPTDPPRAIQYLKFFNFSTAFLFPELLTSVEDICKKQGLQPRGFGCKRIVVQDREVILKDADRRRFEQTWGCDVYRMLCVPENAFYAVECEARSGLHFWEDAFIVEVLDERNEPLPAGETGKLTITNLFAAGSPIIRYKTDADVSLKEDECQCGRTHARIMLQE